MAAEEAARVAEEEGAERINAPPPRAPGWIEETWARVGRPVALSGSMVKWTGPNRRRLPRADRVVLRPEERQRLRESWERSGACGRTWQAYRRSRRVDGRRQEQRMVVQVPCGLRVCPDCARARQGQVMRRVAGPWRLFITLTLPQAARSPGTAWRQVSGWIRRWLRALRRLVRQRDPRVRCEGRLAYAWVLEAHRSGFPHIHLALSASWLDAHWIRQSWGACHKWGRCRVDVQRARKTVALNWYLAKYLSKARLTPDILAIMYRRRLVASTMRAASEEEQGWTLESRLDQTRARLSMEEPERWGRAEGWRMSWSVPGAAAMWVRWVYDEGDDPPEATWTSPPARQTHQLQT